MNSAFVEEILPQSFFRSLGIYLQSAAHIELAIWHIILKSDKNAGESVARFLGHLDTKRNTMQLIAEFKKCAKAFPHEIEVKITELADRIEVGILDRNLITHGAFSVNPTDGILSVTHFEARGRGKAREWFDRSRAVSEQDIKVALLEIDTILREARQIFSKCLKYPTDL